MAARKPSMLKRDRERARDEKAARKREDRVRKQERGGQPETGPRVATREELDGYGLPRDASGDPFEDGNRG